MYLFPESARAEEESFFYWSLAVPASCERPGSGSLGLNRISEIILTMLLGQNYRGMITRLCTFFFFSSNGYSLSM